MTSDFSPFDILSWRILSMFAIKCFDTLKYYFDYLKNDNMRMINAVYYLWEEIILLKREIITLARAHKISFFGFVGPRLSNLP